MAVFVGNLMKMRDLCYQLESRFDLPIGMHKASYYVSTNNGFIAYFGNFSIIYQKIIVTESFLVDHKQHS